MPFVVLLLPICIEQGYKDIPQQFSQNVWRTDKLDVIAVQKVEAAYKKADDDHRKFKSNLAKDPQFLQNMQTELLEIDLQMLQLGQDR